MNESLRKTFLEYPTELKVTADQVAIIERLKTAPSTPVDLATHFKVSRQTIHNQLSGLYKYGLLTKPKHPLDNITLHKV